MITLTKYEYLLSIVHDEGISIYDNYFFKSDRIRGLYCDNSIAISNSICTTSEKLCIMAEELGHHYTSFGNIIELNVDNLRQEMRARIWSYNQLIGLQGIIDCYKSHCSNIYEMAEYLDVTEEFLNDALDYYRKKYGPRTVLGNYTILFEPTIYVYDNSCNS